MRKKIVEMATTPPKILSAAPKMMFGSESRCCFSVSCDVEPVIETVDRAVVLSLRDRLRYRRRELVDLRDEWRDEGRQDGDEADDESEEDHGGRGFPAEAGL